MIEIDQQAEITDQGIDPVFTVIINNFNYQKYLRTCIESVLRQSYGAYELIVVDDGSSDSSISIIRSYESKVKLIQTEHVGQARACLAAVQLARGAYIYFLDADDEAMPDLLSTVKEFLNPLVSKIQFQLIPVDEISSPIGSPFPIYPVGFRSVDAIKEIERYGMYTTPQTSGNVFSRSLICAVGDIAYERAIDGITLLLAPYYGTVVSINSPLAKYRVHSNNASMIPSADRFIYEKDRFSKRLKHLEQILVHKGTKLGLQRDAERMFYSIDREALVESISKRLSARTLVLYLVSLISQRPLKDIFRLASWAIMSAILPAKKRSILLCRRANAWSKLKGTKALMVALFE